MRSTKPQPAKPSSPPAARKKLTVVTGGAKSPADTPAPPRLAPSTPQPFALSRLRRAPENVRHVRIDEDVTSLADDIAAHGLLQSLIGYEADGTWPEDAGLIMIVGGGRRLQALQQLRAADVVDDAFTVPVLIRDREEAIELSLAENLQQRTMSPVDEFLAFKALMDTGHHSPEGLAARFGYSERVVKQRLRLADVVPEVLDALATQRITIDAAAAYATTQDLALQAEVFNVQDRKTWEPHRPQNIRHDITTRGMRTTDPVFAFVTPEIYERDGGGYEDDLFVEGADANRDGRVLAQPFIARAAAERMIDFQAIRLIEDLKRDDAFSPTIVGHVRPKNLRVHRYGCGDLPKPPKGFVEIDRRYGNHEKIWNAIRRHGVDVHVVIGINDKAELAAYPERVFVPTAHRDVVDPRTQAEAARHATPEEIAAASREREVVKLARRLAVGPFTGTPFEGRAFWQTGYHETGERRTIDGVPGWVVPVHIFVTDEQVAAQRAAAESAADAAIAATEAQEKRREALLASDPQPAAIVVDDLVYYRWADGSYWDAIEDITIDEGDATAELGARTLASLIAQADTIGPDWPSVEAAQLVCLKGTPS